MHLPRPPTPLTPVSPACQLACPYPVIPADLVTPQGHGVLLTRIGALWRDPWPSGVAQESRRGYLCTVPGPGPKVCFHP